MQQTCRVNSVLRNFLAYPFRLAATRKESVWLLDIPEHLPAWQPFAVVGRSSPVIHHEGQLYKLTVTTIPGYLKQRNERLANIEQSASPGVESKDSNSMHFPCQNRQTWFRLVPCMGRSMIQSFARNGNLRDRELCTVLVAVEWSGPCTVAGVPG